MVRRGFGPEAERLAARVKKRTKKADGLDVTLDELNEAEYESGFPLEPTVARLFRRYRGIRDAVDEFAVSWGPLKRVKSEGTKPLVAPTPVTASNIFVPYGLAKAEMIRETLSVLAAEFRKEKKQKEAVKKERNENIVEFLRGIHCALRNATGRPIPWSVVPDSKTVKSILEGHSDSIVRWATSPPSDLAEQLQKLGGIAGLIEVWTRLGELVLIYGKPTTFFKKYAPDLTPALFDPVELNERIGPAKTLGRCLFVWGPSALLNPVVREAFDRAARRGMAFQEVVTAMTGRTSYRVDGAPQGRHGRKPATVTEDRRRNRLVEAITYLGKTERFRTPKVSSVHMNVLKREGCWLSVEPLVGKDISYRKAYEIVGKHLGVTASAIKKSCSHPDKD